MRTVLDSNTLLSFQLLVYVALQTSSVVINFFMLFVVGMMVNGPYALITTSVSAELGKYLIIWLQNII